MMSKNDAAARRRGGRYYGILQHRGLLLPAPCVASPVGPYRDLGAHMGMEKESSLVHGDVGVENKIGGRGEVNVSRSKSN